MEFSCDFISILNDFFLLCLWVSDVQGGVAVAREASNERLAEPGT